MLGRGFCWLLGRGDVVGGLKEGHGDRSLRALFRGEFCLLLFLSFFLSLVMVMP